MAAGLFVDLSILLFISLGISLIIYLLKQPLIIGYILAGIITGPYLLNLINTGTDGITTFATLGVSVLLFMVGLSLEPRIIKEVGKVAIAIGIGQILLSTTLGFLIGLALGFTPLTSIYVAIAISFSSTIIMMKILSDKEDTESLYGRISLGFLIVQDIVAVILLLFLPSIVNSTGSIQSLITNTILKGASLSILLFITGVYIFPRLTKFAAKSQELLLVFAIGWCLAVASVFHFYNFSVEIGALLAGISLSLTPYRHEISSRMRPLRDFFLVIFFFVIGAQVRFSDLAPSIAPIIIFSAFILIVNPMIVTFLMGRLGYTKKTGFNAGLTVSQMSEFSFILIALAVTAGHVPLQIQSALIIIRLITIGGSTYALTYSNKIYRKLSRSLGIFERSGRKIDESKFHLSDSYDVVLFGYNRTGYNLLEAFKKMKKKILVVDFNPDTIKELIRDKVDCHYGDVGDAELLNDLNLGDAKLIASTVPDLEANLLLIQHAKSLNKNAVVIVLSYNIDDAIKLYREGATYVITPQLLGGKHTADLIEKHGLDLGKFKKEKYDHIKELQKRKKLGHNYTNFDVRKD